MRPVPCAVTLTVCLVAAGAGPREDNPLTPAEAIKRVNEKVIVQMLVKATKNRLERRKEI